MDIHNFKVREVIFIIDNALNKVSGTIIMVIVPFVKTDINPTIVKETDYMVNFFGAVNAKG